MESAEIRPARTRGKELRRSFLGSLIFRAYRLPRLRRMCIRFANELEGGEFYSETLRRIFRCYHNIEVGAYSYGDCFVVDAFPPGTTVGRYVSIATGIRAFARNHPTSWLSMHPFFYNHRLGLVPRDLVTNGSLEIGDDAWIGCRTIITPGCSRIGVGAVVGAGSVVTKDIPDFAVVAGNPARVIRYRFPEETQQAILDSRWWDLPVTECIRHLPEMTRPLERPSEHPLLQSRAAGLPGGREKARANPPPIQQRAKKIMGD